MNNINQVLIEGVVTEKPELKIIGNNKFCCINICYEQSFKDITGCIRKSCNYFVVHTYNKLAEVSAKKTDKDCVIRIVGKLQQSKWFDCNGKENSRIIIIAEAIEFLTYENELKKKSFLNKNKELLNKN